MKTKSTEHRILLAAQTLMGSKGYAGVSMSAIADEVGVTKASLYYFFKSKQDIYIRVLGDIIDEVTKHYSVNNDEKVTKASLAKKIVGSLQYGIKKGSIILSPEIDSLPTDSERMQDIEHAAMIMQKTVEQYVKRAGAKNPEFAAQALIDMTHAYVKRAMQHIPQMSQKKFAEQLTTLITH